MLQSHSLSLQISAASLLLNSFSPPQTLPLPRRLLLRPARLTAMASEDPRIAKIASTIRVIPDFPKPGIKFQDITTMLLDPKAFQDTTDLFVERYKGKGITVVAALKRLQDSGAAYVVLDLRDNLGGLVQVGVEVAKLFLNKGETVTYTAGRDPQVQKSIIADAAPLVTSPVIVLVNNRTASASEIVASALHDNCRAVLVGERTYGKGLIQSVFELLDGSGVVVTIGKYVTPNHKDINGNGIVPDFSSLPALSEVTDYISRCQIGKAG